MLTLDRSDIARAKVVGTVRRDGVIHILLDVPGQGTIALAPNQLERVLGGEAVLVAIGDSLEEIPLRLEVNPPSLLEAKVVEATETSFKFRNAMGLPFVLDFKGAITFPVVFNWDNGRYYSKQGG